VEVLFDPEEYRLVAEVAEARGQTIGALVRRAVAQLYLNPALEERKAAVQGILDERSEVTWEDARELLERDVGRRIEAP
jgi:hypothetical protein